MAIDRMAASPAIYFESPGDLGPGYQPPAPSAAPAVSAPAHCRSPCQPALRPDPIAAQMPGESHACRRPDVHDTGARTWRCLGRPNRGEWSGRFGARMRRIWADWVDWVGSASRIVDAMTGLLGSAGDQARRSLVS